MAARSTKGKGAAAKPAAPKPELPASSAAAIAAGLKLNPVRGEVGLKLGDTHYKLCLTLNALIEVEQGLGCKLADMGEALTNPSLLQLRTMLGALVRGGGANMTDEEVGSYPFDAQQASEAIMSTFQSAGLFQPLEDGAAPSPQM